MSTKVERHLMTFLADKNKPEDLTKEVQINEDANGSIILRSMIDGYRMREVRLDRIMIEALKYYFEE